MIEKVVSDQLQIILERFQESMTPDERDGYEGYIVSSGKLIDIAQSLRDDYGYDYLSSVTGVDYFPEEQMEVVYHFYKMTGGSSLVLKTQTPRDNAVVPSLAPIYPGAEFQEREIWDLFGIRFENHPDLRRILLWEGFNGHPLRKDWQEPYFEAEVKPFKSRTPQGQIRRAEDISQFSSNVRYSSGFDPEQVASEVEPALYASL